MKMSSMGSVLLHGISSAQQIAAASSSSSSLSSVLHDGSREHRIQNPSSHLAIEFFSLILSFTTAFSRVVHPGHIGVNTSHPTTS